MLQEKAAIDTVEIEVDEGDGLQLVDRVEDIEAAEKRAEKAAEPDKAEPDKDPAPEPKKEPEPEKEPETPKRTRADKRIHELLRDRARAEAEAAAAATARDEALAALRAAQQAQKAAAPPDPLDEAISAIDAQMNDEADDPAMTAVLRSQKLLLEREKRQAEERERREPVRQQAEPQQPANNEPHPAAKRWLEENSWYTDRDEAGGDRYSLLKDSANREYKALLNYYGSDSDELFEELRERLSRKAEFDHILSEVSDPDPAPPKVEKKAPARPSRQTTSPRNAHESSDRQSTDADGLPQFDSGEIARLKALGLDPYDPQVRKMRMKYNPEKYTGSRR